MFRYSWHFVPCQVQLSPSSKRNPPDLLSVNATRLVESALPGGLNQDKFAIEGKPGREWIGPFPPNLDEIADERLKKSRAQEPDRNKQLERVTPQERQWFKNFLQKQVKGRFLETNRFSKRTGDLYEEEVANQTCQVDRRTQRRFQELMIAGIYGHLCRSDFFNPVLLAKATNASPKEFVAIMRDIVMIKGYLGLLDRIREGTSAELRPQDLVEIRHANLGDALGMPEDGGQLGGQVSAKFKGASSWFADGVEEEFKPGLGGGPQRMTNFEPVYTKVMAKILRLCFDKMLDCMGGMDWDEVGVTFTVFCLGGEGEMILILFPQFLFTVGFLGTWIWEVWRW